LKTEKDRYAKEANEKERECRGN